MASKDYLTLGSSLFFLWIIPCLLFIGHGFKLNLKMKWKIMATGLITPWIIGTLLKIYLDFKNKITFPWSYFLKPQGLAVLIPASL